MTTQTLSLIKSLKISQASALSLAIALYNERNQEVKDNKYTLSFELWCNTQYEYEEQKGNEGESNFYNKLFGGKEIIMF
jgi:hypothetical protein